MYRIIWGILFLLHLLFMNQPDDVFEADLIFDRQEGDTWTVYAADLDQLITVPILTGDSRYGCPLVSPDARHMAFNSLVHLLDGNSHLTVYIYDFATQTTQTVGPFAYNGLRDGGISCDMSWSPDSTWLMFHSDHRDADDGFDEYIIRADSSDVRQLAKGWGRDLLAWASDSQSAYISDFSGVARVDLTTMEREILIENRQVYSPQLAPDETFLYLNDSLPQNNERRINLYTGANEILFENTGAGWSWSPDGSIGAVTLGREVYAIQDDELWQVVYGAPANLHSLTWAPDNRTLVMVYGGNYYSDNDPWLVTVDVEQGTFDEIDFLRHGISPMITPDGEWIAFVRKHPDGYEIYRMRLDGSDIAPVPEAVVKVGLKDRWPFVLQTPLKIPYSWLEPSYTPVAAPELPPSFTCPAHWDANECNVLAIIYFYNNGPHLTNATNWGTANEPWYGVTVNENGHVTLLNLAGNQIRGFPTSYIGAFTYLETLILANNPLNITIPPELGNLEHLQYVDLSSTGLYGPIPPELGNLTALTYLDLHDNELNGAIPAELGKLTALQQLNLGNNQLNGPLPDWMDGAIGHPPLGVLTVRDNCGLTAPTLEIQAFVERLDPGGLNYQMNCDS